MTTTNKPSTMPEFNEMNDFTFALPRNRGNIIKVIGVGGGGSNAVNHMFNDGIQNVDFIVANTDSQALENSPVPTRVQIGVHLTEGLGAGSHPEVGRQAAEENLEQLKLILQNNTKLLFITAGMGGGTGTGAAPVIAKLARELNILTVAIVTLPFTFEGKVRREHAERGLEELRKTVDSLIVINNDKLRSIYGNLGFKQGFAKADEVLATATRSIADVINQHYLTNIDLRDARTVLSNSGTALFGSSRASGANRAELAITKALDSPLLNDNHIKGARQVLLLIVSGHDEITMDEIGLINDHIQHQAGGNTNIIMGVGEDASLGEEIAVTIVATGFVTGEEPILPGKLPSRILIPLSEDEPIEKPLHQAATPLEIPLDIHLPDAPTFAAPEPESQETFTLDAEGWSETHALEAAEPVEEAVEEPLFAFDPTMEPLVESTPGEVMAFDEPAEPMFVAEAEEQPESASISWDLEPAMEVTPAAEMVEEMSLEMAAELPVEAPVAAVEDAPTVHTLDLTDMPLLEFERQLLGATPEKPVAQTKQPSTQLFEEEKPLVFKVESKAPMAPAPVVHEDPFEATASQALNNHMATRKDRLQAFNYKFRQTHDKLVVEEMEKVPAYKRMGLEIEASDRFSAEGKFSGTELNDSNGELNIRNHNRFLHDNVD
jgi:cell division protein FtsZ